MRRPSPFDHYVIRDEAQRKREAQKTPVPTDLGHWPAAGDNTWIDRATAYIMSRTSNEREQ